MRICGQDYAISWFASIGSWKPKASEVEQFIAHRVDVIWLLRDAVFIPLIEPAGRNEAAVISPTVAKARGTIRGFEAGIDVEILRCAQAPVHPTSTDRLFGCFGKRKYLTTWRNVIARFEGFGHRLGDRFSELFFIGMKCESAAHLLVTRRALHGVRVTVLRTE